MHIGDSVRTNDGKVGKITYKYTWAECNVAWAYGVSIGGLETLYFGSQLTLVEPKRNPLVCRNRIDCLTCRSGCQGCQYWNPDHSYAQRLKWTWAEDDELCRHGLVIASGECVLCTFVPEARIPKEPEKKPRCNKASGCSDKVWRSGLAECSFEYPRTHHCEWQHWHPESYAQRLGWARGEDMLFRCVYCGAVHFADEGVCKCDKPKSLGDWSKGVYENLSIPPESKPKEPKLYICDHAKECKEVREPGCSHDRPHQPFLKMQALCTVTHDGFHKCHKESKCIPYVKPEEPPMNAFAEVPVLTRLAELEVGLAQLEDRVEGLCRKTKLESPASDMAPQPIR